MDVSRHPRAFRVLSALCALTASCAHLPEGPPVQTRNDIPAAHAANRDAPASAAREIGDRLLALIDSIRDRDDLALAHVARVTGLPVVAETDSVYLYGVRGALAGGWSYRLGATAGADDGADSLLVTFNHTDGDAADRAPICDPDFDAYRTALEAKGFEARPVSGDRGSTRFWEFARDGVRVQVRTIGESDARPAHACVSSLSIRA